MTSAFLPFANLPPLTIVPNPEDNTDEFLQWINRFYEEVALCLNNRVIPFYTIPISDVATDIPNLPTYGSFFVGISGLASGLPSGVWILSKSDMNVAGEISEVVTQDGLGPWATFSILITSTATNYQIRHDRPGVIEQFNISVLGTQILNV